MDNAPEPHGASDNGDPAAESPGARTLTASWPWEEPDEGEFVRLEAAQRRLAGHVARMIDGLLDGLASGQVEPDAEAYATLRELAGASSLLLIDDAQED